MNQQPIAKRDFDPYGRLWVHSIFGPTFQGEGPFSGQRCIFIRLQDCNLQCPGCDTIYHVPKDFANPVQRTHWKPVDLVAEILKIIRREIPLWSATTTLVVISGGEPFRQNLVPLLLEFQKFHEVFVQIETNGTLPPQFPEGGVQIHYDFYSVRPHERRGRYIVCSPKTPKCDPNYDAVACCFKYVLDHRSVDPEDGLPIHVLGNIAPKRVYRQRMNIRPIYLQPMDHSMEHGLDGLDFMEVEALNKASLEAVKISCLKHGYIMQLQMHKLIGVE